MPRPHRLNRSLIDAHFAQGRRGFATAHAIRASMPYPSGRTFFYLKTGTHIGHWLRLSHGPNKRGESLPGYSTDTEGQTESKCTVPLDATESHTVINNAKGEQTETEQTCSDPSQRETRRLVYSKIYQIGKQNGLTYDGDERTTYRPWGKPPGAPAR